MANCIGLSYNSWAKYECLKLMKTIEFVSCFSSVQIWIREAIIRLACGRIQNVPSLVLGEHVGLQHVTHCDQIIALVSIQTRVFDEKVSDCCKD